MTPWLTVVMPVHNGAAHLGATLASAAAERPEGVEFRLYNSAPDGGAARAVADHFRDRLDIVWTEALHLKPWTAKTNLGVDEARAPFATMLHQDDLWRPGHLAALSAAVAAMAAQPRAAMSIGPSRFAGPAGEDLGPWDLPFAPGRHPGVDVAHTLLVQNSVAILAPVFRAETWRAVGGLDDDLWYTADWDLWLKLAEAGDVLVRPAATTAFRIHGGSLTMTGSRDAAAFRAQHDVVLARHMPGLMPLPSGLARRARAGVAINCALAEAANGQPLRLLAAVGALAALGPVDAARFLRESRLIDRLRPRLRLKAKGDFG